MGFSERDDVEALWIGLGLILGVVLSGWLALSALGHAAIFLVSVLGLPPSFLSLWSDGAPGVIEASLGLAVALGVLALLVWMLWSMASAVIYMGRFVGSALFERRSAN